MWAHAHRPELESFFTPWHGMLYSGFRACYTCFFAGVALTKGIWWNVHLFTGTITLAGLTALLASYTILPPRSPTATPKR